MYILCIVSIAVAAFIRTLFHPGIEKREECVRSGSLGSSLVVIFNTKISRPQAFRHGNLCVLRTAMPCEYSLADSECQQRC